MDFSWAVFDGGRAEKPREMLHQGPRRFGKPTSPWILELAAKVSFEEGLTEGRVKATVEGSTRSRRSHGVLRRVYCQ
ncbi:MAG: hypothetical protein WKF53_09890 [Rubrobacter sp.]